MSFWSGIEQNDSVDQSTNFEVIPDKTQLPVIISNVEWKEYEGERYINIKWEVIDGDFKSRIVFQKLKVFDKKKDKRAKEMLAAIDKNAGGKLFEAGVEPDDIVLATCLCHKMMRIMVGVWDIDGKTGNWVMAVSPGKGGAPKQEPKPEPQKSGGDDFDNDIPF